MTKLKFDYQDVENELDAFLHLAKRFIEPASHYVLPNALTALRSYRNQKGTGATDWIIPLDSPLKTIKSNGAYEKGGGGRHEVFAEISAKWRIQNVRTQNNNKPAKQFQLIGIASTKVRLLCCDDRGSEPKQIAMWRMEIADSQAPGCFFHTQILGENQSFPFPSSLPVPRLPGLMLTPVSVTEFVLAELFQDKWAAHLALQNPHLDRWAPIQRERLSRLLKWKLEIIESGGSPWTSLKQHMPQANLFV